MGRLERRLQALEVKEANKDSEWVTPIEVRVHLKALERHHALLVGKELPSYSQEEIEHMRESDLEVANGGGIVAQLREEPGWQNEEARTLLSAWEDRARARLKRGEGLPPERWSEVWGVDEEEEDDRRERQA
jgi:hypothetical protein